MVCLILLKQMILKKYEKHLNDENEIQSIYDFIQAWMLSKEKHNLELIKRINYLWKHKKYRQLIMLKPRLQKDIFDFLNKTKDIKLKDDYDSMNIYMEGLYGVEAGVIRR